MLWIDFFNQSISNFPYAGDYVKEFESLYKKLEWYEIFDLVEVILKLENIGRKANLPNAFNKVLEKKLSPYRVIGKIVQPNSDKETIQKIEHALNNSPNAIIKTHLTKAEKLFSLREHPDFVNSCLESIKAVEGTCRLILSNNKILSDNIKEFKNSKDHNQHIIAILDKLNAFRGNDVAHAKKEGGYTTTREDAILIHTICCGFVNYFKSKKQDI